MLQSQPHQRAYLPCLGEWNGHDRLLRFHPPHERSRIGRRARTPARSAIARSTFRSRAKV